MSAIMPRKIVCTSCGRTAPNRPELAGKRVRCKCGNLISVPKLSQEPKEVTAEAGAEPALDELYDIREEPPRPGAKQAEGIAVATAGEESLPRAAAPNMYATTNRATVTEEENPGKMKWVVIVGIVVVLIVGGFFGIRKLIGPHGATGPRLGEDAEIEQKMRDEYSKDVHAWFEEDHERILGTWSESQALSQTDRWIQQGAKHVLAFGSRLSMVVVIELPDDPEGRKQIFDWQADWHSRHMQKVWTDVGQKYLMIRLGI